VVSSSLSLFCGLPSPPRPLHASPTRRSSDLDDPFVAQLALGAALRHGGDAPRHRDQPRDPLLGHARLPSSILVLPQYCASTASQDRKSTRLHSSHVSISYAVFCLKKQTSQRR